MAAALAPAADRVEPLAGYPLSLYLGVLGTPGLTAYAGLVYALEPKPGQTLAVSAASGAVGSAVGQIARNMGVRVVGIAGTDEKCAYVTDELGFAACVNRRTNNWGDAVKDACPDGIDRYFDTVGGSTLAIVMRHLAMGARITLCGMMEQYNSEADLGGPSLGPIFGKRATLNSIVVYDYFDKLPVWRRLGAQWLQEGRLKTKEDVVVGLDQAPAAFARLMAGENFGKAIVAVSP
jgi:NADPH-dependent curcumin reductase CurA